MLHLKSQLLAISELSALKFQLEVQIAFIYGECKACEV